MIDPRLPVIEVIDTVGDMDAEVRRLRAIVERVALVIRAADLLDESIVRLRVLKDAVSPEMPHPFVGGGK